jgi:pimeloyl-CoA synthetase
LLLNKIYIVIPLIIFILLISGCKKSYEPPPHNLFENEQLVQKTAKDLIGDNVSFTTAGYFETDSVKSIVAGVEVSEKNEWGIKFYLISWIDGEFQKKYETRLLNGSFVQCLVNKIKFSDIENELVYYNSKNYFLGNASGDVYSHVIDLKRMKVYSAHLSVITEGRVTLDITQNIDIPMIKTFFVSYFRRDYPNLRLVEKTL